MEYSIRIRPGTGPKQMAIATARLSNMIYRMRIHVDNKGELQVYSERRLPRGLRMAVLDKYRSCFSDSGNEKA